MQAYQSIWNHVKANGVVCQSVRDGLARQAFFTTKNLAELGALREAKDVAAWGLALKPSLPWRTLLVVYKNVVLPLGSDVAKTFFCGLMFVKRAAACLPKLTRKRRK